MKKLFFILFFVFLLPHQAYAVIANFQVTGLIQTSDSKVMPGSTVVFLDKNGKEVVASSSGPDGRYQAMVPEGEYTVTVKAPSDSKMSDIKFSGQLVHSNTSRDFTFNTGKTTALVTQTEGQVKKTSFGNTLPFIALIIILMLVVFFIILRTFKKNKAEDAQVV